MTNLIKHYAETFTKLREYDMGTPDKRVEEIVEATEKRINDRIYIYDDGLKTIKQLKAVEREEWIATLTQTLQHLQEQHEAEKRELVDSLEDIMKIDIGDTSPTRLALQKLLTAHHGLSTKE